jgi:RNA polymerase sigma-70 factor (ECF subfamily)
LLYRLTLRTDVADDLLQDLFCRLTQSESFQRADNAPAFAYRTAMNLAFDWRRAKKRGPTSEVDVADSATPEKSPLADIVRREELEQTLIAISELPRASRDIIVLRYLEQQSYESIAEQFGKSAHQIRALAHKAIEAIRGILGVDPQNIEETQRAEGK